MKIVVTGGAGYVGWSVINNLLRAPDVEELVVYDNFSRRNYGLLLADKGPKYHKLTIIVDDILNSHGLKKVFTGATCVIHLAALAPSPFSDEYPHAFDQINHWGTAEICYAVEECDVSRFIYISSGAVYGFGDTPFHVTDVPLPVTSYGSSKLDGERHVSRHANSRNSVILRSATVYGVNPAVRFDTFVNRFALEVALGKQLQIHGSGEQHRPIVHVDSLAQAVAGVALGALDSGIYNVVEDNVSITEIASVFQEHVPEVERIYISQGQRLRDLMMEPDSRIASLIRRKTEMKHQIGSMIRSIAIS